MDTLQGRQIGDSALTCKVVGGVLEFSQLGEGVETTIEDEVVCRARYRDLVLLVRVVFVADSDEDAIAFAFDLGLRTPLTVRLSLVTLEVVIS